MRRVNKMVAEFFVPDDEEEEEDEGGAEGEGEEGREMESVGDEGDESVAEGSEGDVEEKFGNVVGNRIFELSDDIAQEHGGAIASDTAPGASHEAEMRNAEDIDGNEHQATSDGEDGTIDGAVDELVPE